MASTSTKQQNGAAASTTIPSNLIANTNEHEVAGSKRPRRHSRSYMEESDSETGEVEDDEEAEEIRPAGLSKAKLREYISFATAGKGLESKARITDDGRIIVSLDLKKALPDLPQDYANPVREFAIDPSLGKYLEGILEKQEVREGGRIPKMNIVIMIVGSRGDVQPYLALGQELSRQGHRVRIATHGTFDSFVTENGLEFYNIGGDPKELMSYMVRNPGLIPGIESLTNGDITRKRKMLAEILQGCWNACTQPAVNDPTNLFVADAIISNPPAFAHIHCAEALGIPLQLSFTMPWCPTTSFPHPLVNISQSNAEPGLTNYLSYALAEIMTWQGLGDVINQFRKKSLGLEPLSIRSGPGILDRLKVPWTYCFSPSLVPKPLDWKNHIDVVGFYFLDLATNYKPPDDLAAFLAAGPPPIYIGFGSVVVKDPTKMTQDIFEATKQVGVRALVSAGWGGLNPSTNIPDHIFILGNVPHDWLFAKVSAVCHHGGAGTTAIGLRLGKPTIIVPFFGDQPFWGAMIAKAGAGPKPIKKNQLDVETLKSAIEFCQTEGARKAAEALGEKIRAHDGARDGVASFYRHLPLLNMRCDLLPERLAVWWSTPHCLRLSAFAVQVLIEEKLIDASKLELHRAKEYESKARCSDPVTGGAIEIFRTITHYYGSITQIFYSPVKGIINTTTAIPRGVIEIVGAMQEGFHNLPQLYGSKVRKTGRVKDFQSGVREGAKGLFYGYADAMTGLVTEPFEGAKKEGFVGFIKGSGRSYINATMRPAAGVVGAFAHPIRGAWMSLRRMGGMRDAEQRIYQVRIEQGKAAVASITSISKSKVSRNSIISNNSGSGSISRYTEEDKERVIEVFKKAIRPENEKERRKTMEERIQAIITQGGAGTVTVDDHDNQNKGQNNFENVNVNINANANASTDGASLLRDEGAQTVMSPPAWGEEEEADFQRLLEEAKEASLKESEAANSDRGGERNEGAGGDEKAFEDELRKAMELSLAQQREFEKQVLEAAAQWREGGEREQGA